MHSVASLFGAPPSSRKWITLKRDWASRMTVACYVKQLEKPLKDSVTVQLNIQVSKTRPKKINIIKNKKRRFWLVPNTPVSAA